MTKIGLIEKSAGVLELDNPVDIKIKHGKIKHKHLSDGKIICKLNEEDFSGKIKLTIKNKKIKHIKGEKHNKEAKSFVKTHKKEIKQIIKNELIKKKIK